MRWPSKRRRIWSGAVPFLAQYASIIWCSAAQHRASVEQKSRLVQRPRTFENLVVFFTLNCTSEPSCEGVCKPRCVTGVRGPTSEVCEGNRKDSKAIGTLTTCAQGDSDAQPRPAPRHAAATHALAGVEDLLPSSVPTCLGPDLEVDLLVIELRLLLVVSHGRASGHAVVRV